MTNTLSAEQEKFKEELQKYDSRMALFSVVRPITAQGIMLAFFSASNQRIRLQTLLECLGMIEELEQDITKSKGQALSDLQENLSALIKEQEK